MCLGIWACMFRGIQTTSIVTLGRAYVWYALQDCIPATWEIYCHPRFSPEKFRLFFKYFLLEEPTFTIVGFPEPPESLFFKCGSAFIFQLFQKLRWLLCCTFRGQDISLSGDETSNCLLQRQQPHNTTRWDVILLDSLFGVCREDMTQLVDWLCLQCIELWPWLTWG